MYKSNVTPMDHDDQDETKEYRWETGYEKTWEAIKEDDDGLFDGALAELLAKSKRQRQEAAARMQKNRLGVMRHLYIILDCSEAMTLTDLKPTRFRCTLKVLAQFIEEFFDQNPICQLGLIILRNKRAEKLTELTGTPNLHLAALKTLEKYALTGEPSLQNGLDQAYKALKIVPTHASREILIIMGSLITCDPIDINYIIDAIRKANMRCSVISLSAEIHVCRSLAERTLGTYSAVLDDAHFRDQLMAHVPPPAAAEKQSRSLIKMGFPHARHPGESKDKDPPLSMCQCHRGNDAENRRQAKLSAHGYYCPQCRAKYCELPAECTNCGLMLVSAPHLARSYHYLFPVPKYTELEYNGQAAACFACQHPFNMAQDRHVYRCETCMQIFCMDCDIFMHESLHLCVGCRCIPSVVAQLEQHQGQQKYPNGTSSMAAASNAAANAAVLLNRSGQHARY